jgi:hypothetical protein
LDDFTITTAAASGIRTSGAFVTITGDITVTGLTGPTIEADFGTLVNLNSVVAQTWGQVGGTDALNIRNSSSVTIRNYVLTFTGQTTSAIKVGVGSALELSTGVAGGLTIASATDSGIEVDSGSLLVLAVTTDVSLCGIDGIRIGTNSTMSAGAIVLTSGGGANTGYGVAITSGAAVSCDLTSTITGGLGDVLLGSAAGAKTWVAIAAGAAATDRNDYTLAGSENVSINT